MSALASDIANALLHSVWQVGLLGLAYLLVLRLTHSARVRYVIGCGALLLCVAVPLGWFFSTSTSLLTVSSQARDSTIALPTISSGAQVFARVGQSYTDIQNHGHIPSPSRTEATQEFSAKAWLTIAWLVGICFFALRMPFGFRVAARLRRAASPVPAEVERVVTKLSARLAVQCEVFVAQSERVLVPCVVGFVKPTILLPVSLVSGLTSSELESILAHELAHVRRHDFVVNLAQSLIETLLFYHPAVWWISGIVRHERENCCDDLVLTVCGDRKAYASALLTIGEVTGAVGVAANGGTLFRRIKRILGQQQTVGSVQTVSSVARRALAALLLMILIGAGAAVCQEDDKGQKSETTQEKSMNAEANDDAAYLNRWQIDEWHRAIESDHAEAVARLLEEDDLLVRRCIQKFRKDGTWFLVDSLCEAARRNCIPVAKLILEADRSPNVTFGQGQWNGEVPGAYCLAWAGSEEMRQFLLDNGADPATIEGIEVPHLDEATVPLEETTDNLGLQWQLAIETGDEAKVRDLLATHPQLSRQVTMDRWRDGRMGHRSRNPLWISAQADRLSIVKMMIEAGYDKSKLVDAVELAAPEVAAYLVDDLGVEAKPNVGLMAYIGDTESLKFWLARGHKAEDRMLLDACGNRGRYRGHKHDVHGGWPEKFRATVQVLIEAGANVNGRMPSGNEKYEGCKPWRMNGETPLHFSAGNWDPVQIKMLLDAGADKTLKNDLGETPYDWAVKFEAPEETKTLLRLDDDAATKEKGPTKTSSHQLGPDQCPEDCSAEAWRLFCASANGDLASVKQIIHDSPELAHSFIWYESPLHFAVRENHIEIVRELLAAGINPAYSNWTYSSWQKILPIAKDRGYDELHTLLVAEMQKRFNYDPGYEPLWAAIVAGDVDEVKKLIAAEPKLVNIGDEHGNRAIHWAILARRIPIIQLLLDAGADINAKRADMQSPLHLALEGGDYWFGKKNAAADTTEREVAEFIRDNGANYEFSAAVAFNDIDHVKAELAKQPGLANQLNDSRRSPLYVATIRGHLDLVRLLLEHGADTNLSEHCADKGRPLFEASDQNNIDMMKLLIEHGADADAYVDSSGNCLSIAQQGGPREAEAVELLKKHSAKPGEWELDSSEKVSAALEDQSFVPNRDMWSSILGKILELDDPELLEKYVARFGADDIRRLNPAKGWRVPRSQKMLNALVKNGTSINARDWFGRTFLHYAAFDETSDRTSWLLANGAEIDAVDHQSGTTPLGLAAWNGGLPLVDFLLSSGANANLPDAEWARPLSFAKAEGHVEVIARLERAT